ncbi:hypothetical protein [Rickettsia endosymbiont of Ixodes scapularis]|uniref:hypothetical protein n=1 Tax=Rickettsia endosymbiont of Ixodes scapularis TaxID=444612 RepID=UPI0001A60657|nr:hypothetical protein [Rickettsia endosymbiont of Ixodes scapularis]EER22465.1 transposase [Rickettsia endosymbiont of Ixodes scapularis]
MLKQFHYIFPSPEGEGFLIPEGDIKLLGKFEHSRHRSVTNAFVHMVAALINYQMSDNKPSITSLLIC